LSERRVSSAVSHTPRAALGCAAAANEAGDMASQLPARLRARLKSQAAASLFATADAEAESLRPLGLPPVSTGVSSSERTHRYGDVASFGKAAEPCSAKFSPQLCASDPSVPEPMLGRAFQHGSLQLRSQMASAVASPVAAERGTVRAVRPAPLPTPRRCASPKRGGPTLHSALRGVHDPLEHAAGDQRAARFALEESLEPGATSRALIVARPHRGAATRTSTSLQLGALLRETRPAVAEGNAAAACAASPQRALAQHDPHRHQGALGTRHARVR
jgi:hypothetical protein